MGDQGAAQFLHSLRITIGKQLIFIGINRLVQAMLKIQIREYVHVRRSRGKINQTLIHVIRIPIFLDYIITALRNRINGVPFLKLSISTNHRTNRTRRIVPHFERKAPSVLNDIGLPEFSIPYR